MITNNLTQQSEPVTIRQFFPGQIATHKIFKKHGWAFNWKRPFHDKHNVYGLYARGREELLGLIAFEEKEDHVFIHNVEVSPVVLRRELYKGIGKHLVAYACKRSMELGADGFVSTQSKTLSEGFYEKIGAKRNGKTSYFIVNKLIAEELIFSCFKDQDIIREVPSLYKSDKELRRLEIRKKLEEFDDLAFDKTLDGTVVEDEFSDYEIPRIRPILDYCREHNKDPEELTNEEVMQFMVRKDRKKDKQKMGR